MHTSAPISSVRPQAGRRHLLPTSVIALALILSYFTAAHFPNDFGWENGIVENTQAILLFAGGVLALFYARHSTDVQMRAFWIMVAPIWFVMVMRELSWGAVFMPPLTLSPETGPTFSSTQQLWYKPAVAPVVGLLAAACMVLFAKTRQAGTLATLWRGRAFPLLEIVLFVICMVVSAAAEGHMGLSFHWEAEWALQNLEEMAELCAYAALIAAQQRVRSFLRH